MKGSYFTVMFSLGVPACTGVNTSPSWRNPYRPNWVAKPQCPPHVLMQRFAAGPKAFRDSLRTILSPNSMLRSRRRVARTCPEAPPQVAGIWYALVHATRLHVDRSTTHGREVEAVQAHAAHPIVRRRRRA